MSNRNSSIYNVSDSIISRYYTFNGINFDFFWDWNGQIRACYDVWGGLVSMGEQSERRRPFAARSP